MNSEPSSQNSVNPGSNREVQERLLQAENKALEAQKRIEWCEGILQALKQPIIVTNSDRVVTDLNETALLLINKSKDKVLGQSNNKLGLEIGNAMNRGIDRISTDSSPIYFSQKNSDYIVECAQIIDKKHKESGHVEIFNHR